MRSPAVIWITGCMTSELPPDPRPKPARRTSNVLWILFLVGTVVLALLALLPVVGTLIAVALFGLGGSGSNK